MYLNDAAIKEFLLVVKIGITNCAFSGGSCEDREEEGSIPSASF